MNSSHYIGSVSTSLLMMVVDFCKVNKLATPEECFTYLNKENLEPKNLTERIPFQLWMDILFAVHRQYPIQGLGLQIAKHIKLSHAGILSYLAFSESNLFEAVPDFIIYNRLVYDFNLMHFHAENDLIELSWGDYRGRPGLLIDETAIALFFNIVKQAAFPYTITLKHVKFIYKQPQNLKIYQDYFQCPVFFNSPVTAVVFSVSEVKKIFLSKSDPILYRILKNQTDDLISQLELYDEFEQRLHISITHCIQQKDVNSTAVAKHMGISSKILRQSLAEKGINFNTVLNQVRMNLAKQYLKDKNLNINEIADRLGYAEQSVFQRAFKSWTGETPLKFRKRND